MHLSELVAKESDLLLPLLQCAEHGVHTINLEYQGFVNPLVVEVKLGCFLFDIGLCNQSVELYSVFIGRPCSLFQHLDLVESFTG